MRQITIEKWIILTFMILFIPTYVAATQLPASPVTLGPGTYNYTIPAGVSTLTVDVKGAGGGGGLTDSEGNQELGKNGDLVSHTVNVTPGEVLTFIVGTGGDINFGIDGGNGGGGYTFGNQGEPGTGDPEGAFSYGGSGGGGSSGIKIGSTRLVEAAGGAGGRSSDYFNEVLFVGGSGGASGGSNYPLLTTQYGGGNGGNFNTAGDNGSIYITYSVSGSNPPQYSSNSTNSTIAGTTILHSLFWTDTTGLNSYIFSFNNGSGTFVNDSVVFFSGTSNWSNVTKAVNSTAGTVIRWCVYTNNTNNIWNSSSCTNPFNYTTTSTSSCGYSGSGNWAFDCSVCSTITENTNLLNNNITFSGAGIVTLSANITNWTRVSITNQCRVIVGANSRLRKI